MNKQVFIIRGILIVLLAVGVSVLFLSQGDGKREESIDYDKVEENDYPEVRIDESDFEDIPVTSHPIVASVRNQIGVTTEYDPSYVVLEYPFGDVPIKGGVCTDVIIRALRDAYSMDLQELVHEDMKVAFNEYPNKWGLQRPDRNIDHRRVLNLKTYFNRKGYSVGVSNNSANYLPGDIITCRIPGDLPHVMIVSDRKTESGVPLIFHNIGAGTKEENRLFEFKITGHYRIKASD